MTEPPHTSWPEPDDRPTSLLVVGAAAGMGRWLAEHVFPAGPWADVVLVDTSRSSEALTQVGRAFSCPVATAAVPDGHPAGLRDLLTGRAIELATSGLVVCLAVPRSALPQVGTWLDPLVAPGAPLLHVSASLGPSLADLRRQWPGRSVFGAHPLFDSSARGLDGQTILVVPDEGRAGDDHLWLSADIHRAGGIAKLVSAEAHDRDMSYVQTMAHQTLLNLIDAVASSGLDLEEVWEVRTPLFEALFGLASRVVAESREEATAEIQTALDGGRVAEELRAAAERTAAAVGSGSTEEVSRLVRSTRDRFSGALFEAIQATAAAAVSAAQAKRAELAHRGRTGALVGVRPVNRPHSLRVGHIIDVTPTSVALREVMVGTRGTATLLEGPGRRNAARVGRGGKPKDTVFGLAHIDVVLGDELEDELDGWLAHIRRDIRFLVPESVAGAGVLDVVGSGAGIRDAEVVSEVVRTGQRSVVVRVGIRADHDVDEMVEALRTRVQRAYVWPPGVSLPAPAPARLHHLGPAGTFSEDAAVHAARTVGMDAPTLVPQPDFDAVLAGIDAGDLGVLPISSSASGLVSRAARSLLRHRGDVVAGGVVDVAVRFDAYVRPDESLADLRGAKALSHPQGLAQCSAFIRRWELEPVACDSTTEALALVAAAGAGEAMVALAGAERGAALGLRVAEREVDDLSGSITRFLILGPPAAFGDLVGGSDPTLRTISVSASLDPVLAQINRHEAAFDELLTSPEGECLWITSRPIDAEAPGLRHLGRVPWSPRTPVVRVEVAPPA